MGADTQTSRKTASKGAVRWLKFFTFLVLLTGATFAGILYRLFPAGSEQPQEKVKAIYQFVVHPEEAFPGQETINILCLGLDQNWTNRNLPYTKKARSDTMFVVNLSLLSHKVNLLSIPRDLLVRIPDYRGWHRINSASALGGPELAVATVQDFLEVPIDYYMVIKIDATKKLVDALGGVLIDVEKDMDYDDNWGHLHIHLKQGWRHLDGEEAVGYIRFRHDREGDFGRMRRQQQMVYAMLKGFRKPENWMKLNQLLQVARENIETDLSDRQILSLGHLFKDATSGDIRTATLSGENIRQGGASYLKCDDDEKKRLVDVILRGIPDESTVNAPANMPDSAATTEVNP
ncbi:MAG: LCP family protein [Armatimonadetes bacterium]|nr:LCP family protein [Armatimonadota bacterium]